MAIIFIWIDKVHVVNNSQKITWIFTIANSRNVDLTEKQHSRHQQFLRIPLSPLEASSRLPRSRDHLFLHSMSKASLLQGPDMWYLTIYENKVPIYQTTISNSLYFKISPWPLLYETVEQNLNYYGRLRSLTIVRFGSVFCARPVVNVIERCFVTLVDLSILQQFGFAYFLNLFQFEA